MPTTCESHPCHSFASLPTFRKGQVGRWRELFSADHRRLAQDLLGDLLIELGYETDHAWANAGGHLDV